MQSPQQPIAIQSVEKRLAMSSAASALRDEGFWYGFELEWTERADRFGGMQFPERDHSIFDVA